MGGAPGATAHGRERRRRRRDRGLRTLPAWRIERRAKPGGQVRYRVGSVAIGVVLSTAFALLVSDADPSQFFEGLWNSTFGQSAGFEYMLTLTASLLLLGLAAAIPLKIGLWNIGGDGQLFLGAWGAFAIGELFPDMNSSLLIPLMFVAAAVCGAAWSIVPAIARVYLNVNEIISTLMFNFIAVSWVIYWAGSKRGERPRPARSSPSRSPSRRSSSPSPSATT